MDKNDIYYIYSNHLGGGYYATDYEQEYDSLYCETCGDSDQYIASGTRSELLQEYEDNIRRAKEELKQIKEVLSLE